MTQIVRHCQDCDWDRPFELIHDRPAHARTPPTGLPEWSCTACGAGLLIGAPWFAPEPVHLAELRGRVA